MSRKLFANFLDSMHEATREIALAKPFGKYRGDGVPELLADSLVDSTVTQHDELSTSRYDEEKHSVAIFRARHAEPGERLIGSPLNIAPKQRSHRNADLARGAMLSGLD